VRRGERIAATLGLDPRALVGVAVLIGGTLLWVLAFTGGLSGIFGSNTRSVKADFASVEDIVVNDPVRIHGVQVGTVSKVTADPGGRGGTLTMDIDTSDPVYKNASASIVWRTALGANDAVAIDPGTPAAGLLGDQTIPQSHNSNQVELDQITASFHNGAQQGMRTLLQQLGPALSSHPDLGRDLDILARIAPQAAIGIGAVRGQIQDTDLRNLVKNAGQAAQAVTAGTNGSVTRQFVQAAATTLSAFSAEQPALQATTRELTPDAELLGPFFSGFDPVARRAAPVLDKLIAEAGQVAPTLRALTPALTDLHTLLHDATPLLNQLRPAVHSLANSANVGVPVIDSLNPSLERLQNTVLPGLTQTTPETRGHPAYTLIGGTLVSLGNLAGFFDNNGELANLTLGLGAANDVGGTLPCGLDFTGTDLIVCNSLSQTLATLFTGGTSLLGSLIRRPGGQAVYGGLLKAARTLESKLASTQQALQNVAPKVADFLFKNHGAGK
jgi:phospholipid/cholesterol/gamma-HCH transport system substrate-binding protein